MPQVVPVKDQKDRKISVRLTQAEYDSIDAERRLRKLRTISQEIRRRCFDHKDH